MKKSEIDMIDNHQKLTVENLLKLHAKTPQCVSSFLAGSLPGTALVHLIILFNFCMTARMPKGILHQQALKYFSSHKPSSRSWFSQVRDICLLYQLPHPLVIMKSEQSKDSLKTQVKRAVLGEKTWD